MRTSIACYSPTVTRCGIADYSRRLLSQMKTKYHVEVIATEPALERGGYAQVAEKLSTFDLVHVHYEHGFFLHADRFYENTSEFFTGLTVPLVITFHCLPDAANPVWDSVLARADCRVVVHTKYQFDQLSDSVAPERLTLHFHPSVTPCREPPGRAFHQQYLEVADLRLICMYGFIKRHKNYDLVLDTLAELPGDLVLVCVGGPQDRDDQLYCEELKIRALENKLDHRLIITGYLEEADAHAWIQHSDIFIAPYNWISASGSIATALGCEAIILASDLQPNVDFVSRYQCMSLYDRNHPRDLAEKVVILLCDNDKRTSLRAGARRFNSSHSLSALAATIGDLYRSAAGDVAP